MLINPTNPANPTGFNPNVDNTTIVVKPTPGQTSLFNFLLIIGWVALILPGLIWWIIRIKVKNRWVRQQIEINNASSNIDVNLTKRANTLLKLLEQTKGYLKHEREVLTNITKLRAGQISPAAVVAADRALSDLSRSIQIAVENYPDLKASSVIVELMSSSQYLETEIAASRRLYNQLVQRFNADIIVFPHVCMSAKLNYTTFPMFVASEEQKRDVDMSPLSNYETSAKV